MRQTFEAVNIIKLGEAVADADATDATGMLTFLFLLILSLHTKPTVTFIFLILSYLDLTVSS